MSSTSPQSNPPPHRPPWTRALILAAAALAGNLTPPPQNSFRTYNTTPPAVAASLPADDMPARGAISLDALGIKREEYVGERELRRRKTTQYSEAEQEIMELEEYEVATQWFRDLQLFWTALASVGGIYVLYRGGVMWEKWIQEQEKKDMEEEIELTGTFIDPRAVRKDEDDDGKGKKGKGKSKGKDKGPQGKGGNPDEPPNSPDYPKDGLDSLEKLFGKS